MNKVVVTGGVGFIGSHLVEELCARGYDVHSIDNATDIRPDRVIPGATYHQLDIRDTVRVTEVCAGADTIFHEAALPRVQFSIDHPMETFDVNVQGTVSVLTAAGRAGVRRVVYAASSSAYGEQATLPLTEDMQAQPQSPYGLQKYMGELICRTWSEVYELETVSLRYFNVYGTRLDPRGAYALVMPRFLEQRKTGMPLTVTGDGTQTRDFTHVRDVVIANMLAMESVRVGKGEVINIGAGSPASINQVAALVGGPVVHIEARREPRHTHADTARARELLGWAPTMSLVEGMTELRQEWGVT